MWIEFEKSAGKILSVDLLRDLEGAIFVSGRHIFKYVVNKDITVGMTLGSSCKFYKFLWNGDFSELDPTAEEFLHNKTAMLEKYLPIGLMHSSLNRSFKVGDIVHRPGLDSHNKSEGSPIVISQIGTEAVTDSRFVMLNIPITIVRDWNDGTYNVTEPWPGIPGSAKEPYRMHGDLLCKKLHMIPYLG